MLWKSLVCAVILRDDLYLAYLVREIISREEGKPFSICKHKVPGQYHHPDGSEREFCILIETVNIDVKTTTTTKNMLAENRSCLCVWQCGRYVIYSTSTENMLHLENTAKYNGFWLQPSRFSLVMNRNRGVPYLWKLVKRPVRKKQWVDLKLNNLSRKCAYNQYCTRLC